MRRKLPERGLTRSSEADSGITQIVIFQSYHVPPNHALNRTDRYEPAPSIVVSAARRLAKARWASPVAPAYNLGIPAPRHIVNFEIECEREEDGRWLAEVPKLPGVRAYGSTRDEAMAQAQILALHVLAERLEHGESGPQSISSSVASG